jgi:putative PIN family toxin of toxin-antitoxin system
VRVVLDTNIWVSGMLWRGLPWKVLRLAETHAVEPCMAPEMLAELADVLAYERLRPRLDQLGVEPVELVSYAMSLATLFDVPAGPPIVLDDPDDDVFLRCAATAGAVYVVSGDQHLLGLKTYTSIPVVTVYAFLNAELPAEVA